MARGRRLDLTLVERGLAGGRERARALILAGRVRVNGQLADKAGRAVPPDAAVAVLGEDLPYVSRGGLKLAAAIAAFGIDPAGRVCLDVGASTGGFTDCLLQKGAERVYAVDVGYGQLAWPLRQDRRVIPIERTNIRQMAPDALPERVDLITVDVSFISLKIVIPAARPFLRPEGEIVALIKPQFEVGRGRVGKGGVVRDPALHEAVLDQLGRFFEESGLGCLGRIPSPIQGPKGNREFLVHLRPKSPDGPGG